MSPITKSRRSSILKPRKPRNPFSEIDLNPPIPVETTMLPQSRRVSFASSNFIKEFATDPEKNTIWHESYEEAINRSDQSSLASIQQVVSESGCFYINRDDNLQPSETENLSFDSDQFNCTKLDLIDHGSSDNTLDSSNCMELTEIAKYTEADDVYKAQTSEILFNNEIQRHSVITRQTINRSVNMNITEGFIEETNLRECPINTTGAIQKTPNYYNTSDIMNDESINSVDMDTTDIISPSNNFSKFNSCFDGTEQTKTIHGFVQFKSTNQILNRNESGAIPIVVNNSKRQTIHYNQASKNADLEMTNINMNCTEFQQNIPNFQRDMDVTNIQTNTVLKNQSKRQTIHFNQESSNAGLEITTINADSNIQTDFPSLNRSVINLNQNNMLENSELNCIKENIPLLPTKQLKSTIKRQTIHFNQESSNAGLEITNINADSNIQTDFSSLNQNNILENAEFNCIKENIPLLPTKQLKSTIKRQTIHFNQENPNANLEITNINADSNIQTDFPSLNRSVINLNQNNILENSEFKENIPLLPTKQAKSTLKRQTIHYNQESSNAGLEITNINADSNIQTDFPTLNRPAINLNQNKILENSELNCIKENIPLLPTKQLKSIIKRQTIHFNQESPNADLDETSLTPNLIETHQIQTNIHSLNPTALNLNPNEMKLISDIPSTFHCMKENVPQVIKPREGTNTKRQTIHFNSTASYAGGMDETNIETAPNLKRQTIHFNPDRTGGDMEVTESIQSVRDKENCSDLSQIIQSHLKPSSRQTIHFKSEEKNADIDITHINYEPLKSKRQTTHFLEDMEQTQLNKSNISNQYNPEADYANITQPKSSNCDATNFDIDIEETQLVPTGLDKENMSDLSQIIQSHLIPSTCQTIHYQSEANNADIEPSKLKRQTTHFLEDMEQTQLNKSTISTHYNLESDYANITQSKPSNFETINFGTDIEETQLVPTALNNENMSNFSLMMQTHLQPSSRQTIHFQPGAKNADIDITHINYEPLKSKRQTQHFLDDMEQTESVQTLLNRENLSNLCQQQSNLVNIESNTAKRQTLNFDTDDNMEETQSIQSLFSQKNMSSNLSIAALQNQLKPINQHLDINKTDNRPQLVRQSCVYDQETDGGNMEETESVQTLLNKENTPVVSVAELNRQSLFNQKTMSNLSIAALQNQLKPINQHLDINKTDNRPQLVRQSCIYDQETDGGNMEETESAQTLLNKENTLVMSVAELNRQTVPYKQNNEEIIEETQSKEIIPNVPVSLIDANQKSDNEESKIHPDLPISKDKQEIIKKYLNHFTGNTKPVFPLVENAQNTVDLNEISSKFNRQTTANNTHFDLSICKDTQEIITKDLLTNTNPEFPLLETIQNTVDLNEINSEFNSQTTANYTHFDSSLVNHDKLEKSAEISTDNLNLKRPVEMSQDNLFFNNLDANFGIIDDKKQSTSTEPDHCMLVNECGTDRCQRINGDEELLRLSSLITREPSLNALSLNALSYFDSTEKLINYKLNESNCSPMSEYSKIINDISGTTPEMNLPETDCLINTSNKEEEIQSSDENRLLVEPPNNESINYDCSIYKNDSFIIVNSSSETDNDQSIQNLLNNENDTLSTSRNSLELFVDKSKINITSIESESIVLVESFSSQSESDCSLNTNEAHQQSANELNNDEVHIKNMVVFKKFLDTQYPPLLPLKPKQINSQTTENTEEIDKIITLKRELQKTKERLKKLSEREKPLVVETTLEDKIKEKSKDAMWKIISMENDKFEFDFFYQTIRFIVHIDRTTEIVKESQFFSHLDESKAKPRRIYINNIFKIKLSQKVIHSACGKAHDILTLLDYVANLGEQMYNIQNEFLNLEFRYGLKIDSDMNASFQGDSTAFLGIVFDVCFNLRDLDNMTEDCITIKHIVGGIHEAPIKRLINGCPQGIPFIKAYYNNIRQYLEILTNEKKARYYKKR